MNFTTVIPRLRRNVRGHFGKHTWGVFGTRVRCSECKKIHHAKTRRLWALYKDSDVAKALEGLVSKSND